MAYDAAARDAMMRPSSVSNMPITPMGDILPMVVSALDSATEDARYSKTASRFLLSLRDICRDHTVKPYEITADRYKRNLQVIFASDMIINICRSIHERPLGACINLFLVEDLKETACVLRKIIYLAPRIPQPKRLGTRTGLPCQHTIERVFEPYSFNSDFSLPMSVFERLVKKMRNLEKHAEGDMSIEKKYTYLQRMKKELTTDVNNHLLNAQTQMKMGGVHMHLEHMVANCASVDMLSAMGNMGNGGVTCSLATSLDIVVRKQLDQWLVPKIAHKDAIEEVIKVFDAHTSTPTGEGGLLITLHGDRESLPIGGVMVISGSGSLNVQTSQQQATYKRKVRSFELADEDYSPDRLYVQPNKVKDAFPHYTMDSRAVVVDHDREDALPTEEDKKVATTTNLQAMVTTYLTNSLTEGTLLLENVSNVYIVEKDKELNPLVSTLTHTTQCIWNMMNRHNNREHINGDFIKSDKMSHIYMNTGTPDLHLNPSGKIIQMISSCLIKDAVFNDPYIYSPFFANCFNKMCKDAMNLPPYSSTRILFTKCLDTAKKVYMDPHGWHARYRSNKGNFYSVGNGDMIMSELHPYFDALPEGAGLKAYNRLVHGNIPLYIRPAASMLLAGRTLAQKIWGDKIRDFRADIQNATVLAKDINTFFCEIVPPTDRSMTHMLYSLQGQGGLTAPSGASSEVGSMYAGEPMSLIQGMCGLPFIFSNVTTRGPHFTWKDPTTDLSVKLDVPQLDPTKYTEKMVASTCFFYKLKEAERGGGSTFSYMVRPAFHELMKEIRASPDCFAVKMCSMFCAWIRLTAEGTDFAFNNTQWPLAATVLTFKKDDTKHLMIARPNSIVSLTDVPTTEIQVEDDKITISPTAHHRVATDGMNSNSVIALHMLGTARNEDFHMTVSTPPTEMKGIKIADTTANVFTGYRSLLEMHFTRNNRKRTNTGERVISLSGEQIAWLCPPVVPDSLFQKPTNPTGRSSLPRTYDTTFVEASVEMHDPTRDNGTGVSTLNPYATLPGGYVFCIHADPNGKVGEVNNCTYRMSQAASPAAHFFSPPHMMMRNRGSSCLAKRLSKLPCSRRVLGDENKFPSFLEGDSCNSMMSCWSEATGLAQHEPHASNEPIYLNMISNRRADSTYAARRVEWVNHNYAVLGHTFYAKNKSAATQVISPV